MAKFPTSITSIHLGLKGWLFIGLLTAVFIIWVVSCSKHEKPTPPATRPSTPPAKLSNEVPADEAKQKAITDSIDSLTV